ncbi:parathyroid hormone 2 receptor-like [Oppia nitens]|uniref:parathyroid hormone 2 receptor-like n=1 Tax=Oppia nitens TaxID=1686743 RepID=UPI0023D9811D|nr:parathyroid hormone 2 receptor-like [Oppia nitens]
MCPAIWDGALCWFNTLNNTIARQQCPEYIDGFNHNGTAYKYCTKNGTWYFHDKANSTWTNYTDCIPNHHHYNNNNELSLMLIPHIENFRIISKIGYSVSFVTLLMAFIILTFVKRLRCPRNNLHLQLFMSFMIRSFMFLTKSSVDSNRSQQNWLSLLSQTDTSLSFVANNSTITDDAFSCKLFTTIWHYSLVANYNWILMEGLYLHNLIFLHIFNDNSSIRKYIIIGWGLPVLFIILWVITRALYEDTLCWTTNEVMKIFWIIRGPITATIILNFIFFINITRVLFLKMFSSSAVNTVRQYKYRTWFKSTFILVPLFGVHYMFLLVFNSLSALSYDIIEIIWLYIDLLFSSFQGFFVALLYCFFNGEVQVELHKLWKTWNPCDNRKWPASGSGYQSNNNHTNNNSHSTATHMSYLTQSLSYFSRAGGRNSCFSTVAVDQNGAAVVTTTQSGGSSPTISRKLRPSFEAIQLNESQQQQLRDVKTTTTTTTSTTVTTDTVVIRTDSDMNNSMVIVYNNNNNTN